MSNEEKINLQVFNLVKTLKKNNIDWEGDISIETAKRYILDSINISTIIEYMISDNYDTFQQKCILESIDTLLKNMIEATKK